MAQVVTAQGTFDVPDATAPAAAPLGAPAAYGSAGAGAPIIGTDPAPWLSDAQLHAMLAGGAPDSPLGCAMTASLDPG